MVCVNDAQINYTALNLPMGGWKASGLGTRHGANGIRKYTKIQSLLVTRRALKREPFMFPYTPARQCCCGASSSCSTVAARATDRD